MSKSQKGLAVKDFMSQINYADQIRKGVETYLSDSFMLESDFRALLDIPADRFRRAADQAQFEKNKIKHSGRVYWSAAANVTAAKKVQEAYR